MKKNSGEKQNKYIIGIDEVGRATKRRRHWRASLKARASPKKYIIGIDEVGRGPLAGPVTVAACCVIKKFPDGGNKKTLPRLKDSKQLSEQQREIWFRAMRAAQQRGDIEYTIVSIAPTVIDRINISQAANRAATQALEKLLAKLPNNIRKKCHIRLDGGLYVFQNLKFSILSTKTIIKGDEKIREISLASIAAKVTRDQMMVKLHKKHPQYSFHAHKGYGTKMHRDAITRHGLSSAHRLTFTRKYHKMNKT